MTAVAMRIGPVGSDGPDRGISEDARDLSRRMDDLFRGTPSVTRGIARDDLVALIEGVAQTASWWNWDGEGAVPVEWTAVQYAKMFARSLPPEVPTPEVTADRDGDLSLEWDYGPHRVLSVSVRRDGVLHYAGSFGANRSHGSEVLLSGLPASIVQNIRRVAGLG